MVQYYRCRSGSPFRHCSEMWAKERQTCSQASAGIAQQDFSISCLSSLNVTGFLLAKGRVEYPPYSANSTPQGNASGYPKVTWSIWCAGISQLHFKNSCMKLNPTMLFQQKPIQRFLTVSHIYEQWTSGKNRMVNNLSISNIEPCDAKHCFSICYVVLWIP